MQLLRLALILAILGALAGCGDSDDGDSDSGSTNRTASTAEAKLTPSGSGKTDDGTANDDRDTTTATVPNDLPTELLHGDRVADGVSFPEGSDEAEVAQVVDVIYDSFGDGKPKRFCDQVSEQARRQMAKEVGGNTGPDVVCLQTFDPLVLKAGKLKKLDATLKAQVVDVKIDGDRATAIIDFDGKPGDLEFVREDDSWKLAAAPN